MEKDMNILVSEFIQGDRKASVYKDGDTDFIVHMYEGDELREARQIVGHTMYYAEEAAENWILKVIK
jgi:hypothetical protein